MTLLETVQARTQQATGLNKEELEELIMADDRVLHDPFLYDGMSELVNKLYDFKQKQISDNHQLLVVDTDYDTDGVMSAAVLSAALDVFNINYRVYIPSMDNGYGLSPVAVKEMLHRYNVNGYSVNTILTADNGTNAIAGVDEANANGISVLVTDHHLAGQDYSKADVIVNPNKVMSDGSVEPYPYKGNAGAAVAWKAMMAYADRYDQDKEPLIRDLIVFAGIADVSDVMPITDENHYMVKEAVSELQRLTELRKMYSTSVFDDNPYHDVKDTPYVHYNAVFDGLYDMLALLQKSKDEKRASQKKKPIPLTTDEELIGWYLSPMINAPRRIHATSKEAMLSLMSTSITTRDENIESMIDMSAEKSELRNKVTKDLDWDDLDSHAGNVVFVNAQHGIAGLIAGQISGQTNHAAIVFALPTDSELNIYPDNYFDQRFDHDSLVIGSSARSNPAQPLNVIMARIQEMRPDIIVGGGGHAQAAGYSIRYKYLSVFKTLFENVSAQVQNEIAQQYQDAVASGDIQPQTENIVRLSFANHGDTPEYASYNVLENQKTFLADIVSVQSFQNELRPFGKDFDAQTQFELEFNPLDLLNDEYNLNLDFWKTLKFNLYGVEVLTFNIELADLIKEHLRDKNPALIIIPTKLTSNTFRGVTTPQFQLGAN